MTTTISNGLTLTIPDRGQTNWYQTIYDVVDAISGHDHTGSGNGVQIQTAAIANNAVDGTKIRLANNVALRARNAANTADVDLLKLNASDEAEFAGDVTYTGSVSFSSIDINGGTIDGITDLAVVDGGTGASDAATARTNLSAASSGANSDITSLTGLTTDLAVSHGGTGASDAATARSNLGAAASGANTDITSIGSIGNSSIRAGDGVTVTATYLWLKADNNEKVVVSGADSGGTSYPWTFGNASGSYITPPSPVRFNYSTSTHSTDRALSASPTTTELRDVLATLIEDLISMGLLQ